MSVGACRASLLAGAAALVLAAWPGTAEALPAYPLVPVLNVDGTELCDESASMNPTHTDIACNAALGIYSAYVGVDASTLTLRWTIGGDPLTGGGSGPLKSTQWLGVISDESGNVLAGVGIDGKDSGPGDQIYVQCGTGAPAGVVDTLTYTRAWDSAVLEGSALLAPTADPDLQQLTAVVPLTALAPCGIGPTTPVTMTFGTTTNGQLYNIVKDQFHVGSAKPLVQLGGTIETTKAFAVLSGPNPPVVGQETIYTLTIDVYNESVYTVTSGSVLDEIPAGVTIVGAPTVAEGVATVTGQNLSWAGFTLTAGDTDTLTLRVSVTPTALQVGTSIILNGGAVGSGTRADGSPVSDTSDAVGTPDVLAPTGNAPPVAADDAITVAEDSAATVVPVLANDSDPEGAPLTVTSVTQPANGTVTLAGGVVSFTPAAGFSGTTSFDYTVSDGSGTVTATATASVSVTVSPVNDPPVAADDTATVAEDSGPTVLAVLGNDSDVDGGPLAVTA
ncbi:MAG TPA: Ig-like domain-containing protein, partial [Mycobacteriales bacterium]|nr:Ig-like domain-containing protein [Mycobacteriales bacterium]